MTLPMVLEVARGGDRAQGKKSLGEAINLFPMLPDKAVANNRALNEYLESYREAREQGLPDPRVPIAAERALKSEADLYDAWLETRSFDESKLNDPESAQAEVVSHMEDSAYRLWGEEE